MSNEKTNVAEFVSELQAGGWTNTSAGSCGDGRLEALCSLSAGRISQRRVTTQLVSNLGSGAG